MELKIRYSLRTLLISVVAVSIACAIGIQVKLRLDNQDFYKGRSDARRDWENECAVLYTTRHPNGLIGPNGPDLGYIRNRSGTFSIQRFYCADSGLRIVNRWERSTESQAYMESYQREVSRLLLKHGPPPWGLADVVGRNRLPMSKPIQFDRIPSTHLITDGIRLAFPQIFFGDEQQHRINISNLRSFSFSSWRLRTNPEIVVLAVAGLTRDQFVLHQLVFHERGELVATASLVYYHVDALYQISRALRPFTREERIYVTQDSELEIVPFE